MIVASNATDVKAQSFMVNDKFLLPNLKNSHDALAYYTLPEMLQVVSLCAAVGLSLPTTVVQ